MVLTVMADVQKLLVADRIHELQHEAAALRAERERKGHAIPPGPGLGPRARVGRWLIGVGVAIAGSPADRSGETGDRMARPV